MTDQRDGQAAAAETPTPRTDEAQFRTLGPTVSADYACQLERELADLRRQLAETQNLGLQLIQKQDAHVVSIEAEKAEAFRRAESAEADARELWEELSNILAPLRTNGIHDEVLEKHRAKYSGRQG